MFPWIMCGILLITTVLLAVKLILLHKSMDDLAQALQEQLALETNTLLTVSSPDKRLKKLASELNSELRLLRQERRRYQNGDRQLKESVVNIAHDLRTPLTAICGYLELLQKEDTSTAAKRYIAIIQNRVDALKALSEELFCYFVSTAPPKAGQAEDVSLNGALEESIAACYAILKERQITPLITMPAQTISRRLDRQALARILDNILSNAVKYSDGDLTITLTETGEMTFANSAADLDEVQTAKLFDRFYTVTTARPATGLGLAIAKRLTEEMQGRLSADYSDGRLIITLTFPEEPQR